MQLDIALAVIMILGFLFGYSKGVIKTVFSIVSIIIGIIAALKLSPLTIDLFNTMMPNHPRVAYIAGFVATFLVVILLVRFIGNRLEAMLKVVQLNFFNKLIGGLITMLFSVLLFSSVVWFIDEARLISETQKDQSISFYPLRELPGIAKTQFELVKPVFQDFWDKTIDTFERVKQEGLELQSKNK